MTTFAETTAIYPSSSVQKTVERKFTFCLYHKVKPKNGLMQLTGSLPELGKWSSSLSMYNSEEFPQLWSVEVDVAFASDAACWLDTWEYGYFAPGQKVTRRPKPTLLYIYDSFNSNDKAEIFTCFFSREMKLITDHRSARELMNRLESLEYWYPDETDSCEGCLDKMDSDLCALTAQTPSLMLALLCLIEHDDDAFYSQRAHKWCFWVLENLDVEQACKLDLRKELGKNYRRAIAGVKEAVERVACSGSFEWLRVIPLLEKYNQVPKISKNISADNFNICAAKVRSSAVAVFQRATKAKEGQNADEDDADEDDADEDDADEDEDFFLAKSWMATLVRYAPTIDLVKKVANQDGVKTDSEIACDTRSWRMQDEILRTTRRRDDLLSSPSAEIKTAATLPQAVFHANALLQQLEANKPTLSNFQYSDIADNFAKKCEAVRKAADTQPDEEGGSLLAESLRDALVVSDQKLCEERLVEIDQAIASTRERLSYVESFKESAFELDISSRFECKSSTNPALELNDDEKGLSIEMYLKPPRELGQYAEFQSARLAFEAAVKREYREAVKKPQNIDAWAKAGQARVQLQAPLAMHMKALNECCDKFESSLATVLQRLLNSIASLADPKISALGADLLLLSRVRAHTSAHLTVLKQFSDNLMQKEALVKQYLLSSEEVDTLSAKQQALERQVVQARRKALSTRPIEAELKALRTQIAAFHSSPEQRQLQTQLRKLGTDLPEIIQRFPELDPLWRTSAEGIEVRNLSDYVEAPEPLTRKGRVLPNIFQAKLQDKLVAIKKFAVDARNLKLLRRSAHIMCRVKHPNLMSLKAIVKNTGEEWYLEMPYYARGDLRQWLDEADAANANVAENANDTDDEEEQQEEEIAKKQKRREAQGLEILRGLLQGLDILHQVGIVHRDIKPENVMLEEFPAGTNHLRAVLADFEVSKDLVEEGSMEESKGRGSSSSNGPSRLSQQQSLSMLTMATGLVGTPGYVDPRVVQGHAVLSSASDMYAFGVVMGEVLAGQKLSSVEQVSGLKKVDEQVKQVLRSLLSAEGKRPSPSQLLGMALFSPGADIRHCCVTLEQYLKSEGIECDNPFGDRHFISHVSLSEHVKTEANKTLDDVRKREGKVFCPLKVCGSCIAPAYTDLQVAQGGKEAFEMYLQARLKLHEQDLAAKLEAEKARQIKLEVERLARMDAREREIERAVRHIQDEVLTLKCPRCKSAFADFVDCFALKCGHCPCAFCAWCLADAGEDAHQHVARCVHNLAPGRAVFSTRELFEQAHRERQERLIKEFVQASGAISADVLKRLEVNLRACGLGHLVVRADDIERDRALALQLEADELACFHLLDT